MSKKWQGPDSFESRAFCVEKRSVFEDDQQKGKGNCERNDAKNATIRCESGGWFEKQILVEDDKQKGKGDGAAE